MLHLEFAIAPNQISSLADLALLESRMGFEKGAVLSRFPSGWFREVSQQLNAGLDGTQLGRATEKLRKLKSKKLIALGRTFEGDAWAEAAISSHTIKPFHRLIEESFNELPIFSSSLMNLEDDDFVFISQYTRDAESLANAAAALLLGAEKVTIYDPYICATKPGCCKTLLELMRLCQKEEIEFHIFSKEDPRKPAWITTVQALDAFKLTIPENIKMFWYCADDQGSGFLHSRGLFTAKGGLVYDRGFEEPNDRAQRTELTDITPMPNDMLQAKAISFNTSLQYDDFDLVREVWVSHLE
ncbi:hypothetical protein HJ152_04735 [Vibrio parahaemolyticus]|nr:hypothetical protein [Vibrio parahaemolyticus]